MTEDASGSAGTGESDEPAIRGEGSHPVSGVVSRGTDGAVHRTSYDASTDGSLGAAVVVAIAEATERPTHDIDPLYETVDPDALSALFGPRRSEGPRRRGVVSFVHDGCHVTVDGDEIVVDTERSGR